MDPRKPRTPTPVPHARRPSWHFPYRMPTLAMLTLPSGILPLEAVFRWKATTLHWRSAEPVTARVEWPGEHDGWAAFVNVARTKSTIEVPTGRLWPLACPQGPAQTARGKAIREDKGRLEAVKTFRVKSVRCTQSRSNGGYGGWLEVPGKSEPVFQPPGLPQFRVARKR